MSSAIKRILDKEQLKFATLLLIFYCLIFFSGSLWRIDNVIYDAHMKYWSQPAPSDIVIIEIDEQSLRAYGRWPWPRSVHANLIEKLSAVNTRGIVLDLIFSENNNHDIQSDARLVEAIENNDKVILPVIVEHNRLNGQLIETLPFPKLLNSARDIGHVHVELDQDGIARSTYLQEGLTTPHWDNISLSLYKLIYGQSVDFIPGAKNPLPVSDNPNVWVRDYHVYIPFIGAPGHLARVSYADVLSPDFPLSTLDNKIIFIGATATGLGDALPTPVSGERNAMPGVEINATIFHALRTNTLIEKSGPMLTLLVGLIFVLLPVFIFPRVSPLSALLSMLALVIGLAIVTILLLRMYHLWIPPAASLAVLLGSFPLWSWRRLDLTVKSLNEELELLNAESSALKYRVIHSLNDEFNFLSQIVPVTQINVSSHKFNQHFNFSNNVENMNGTLSHTASENDWQYQINYINGATTTKNQDELVEQFLAIVIETANLEHNNTIELVQRRVEDVKHATNQLRTMRKIIDESIDQMPDGLLIINQFGLLININNQAKKTLKLAEKINTVGSPLFSVLNKSDFEFDNVFKHKIFESINTHAEFSLQSQTNSGLSIMVKGRPVLGSSGKLIGLIINIADITQIKEQEHRREELINFLSHDLRAPLISTISELDMANNRNPSGEQKVFLDRLRVLNSRALTLAEGFVQFTRAENLNEINLEEINLVNICDNAIDQQWALSNQKQITITPHYSSPSIEILGDFDLMERAFVNLISNAIKYSPTQTNITITIDESISAITCIIKDQGYGIEKRDMDKLFTRFQRNASTKNLSEGIGLGLAFVKTVIEKHGGSINVSSEPGKGSEFILEFDTGIKDSE